MLITPEATHPTINIDDALRIAAAERHEGGRVHDDDYYSEPQIGDVAFPLSFGLPCAASVTVLRDWGSE